jgi:hypothetical protein
MQQMLQANTYFLNGQRNLRGLAGRLALSAIMPEHTYLIASQHHIDEQLFAMLCLSLAECTVYCNC